MVLGLILFGSVIGAIAALVLGQTIWMALLIYSGVGVLAVLVGVAIVAFRTGPAPQSDTEIQSLTRTQRS